MHSVIKVIGPTFLSVAEQQQNQGWCQRRGEQASGPDSESQIELGVKPGLMTKSLSERDVKNLRRSNNRITARKQQARLS